MNPTPTEALSTLAAEADTSADVLPAGVVEVGGKRYMPDAKGHLVPLESVKPADKLMDIRKVNYVTLGGDNAGEHLLM